MLVDPDANMVASTFDPHDKVLLHSTFSDPVVRAYLKDVLYRHHNDRLMVPIRDYVGQDSKVEMDLMYLKGVAQVVTDCLNLPSMLDSQE